MFHPTSIIETRHVGENTRIWAFAHVCPGARIGRDCVVGEGVYIGPDVIVGDRCKIQNHALLYRGVFLDDEVFIGPNVVTTNDVMPRAVGAWDHRFRQTFFRKGSSVGANSTILCGVTLREMCMVAAGSVVTGDVMAGSLVKGSPARHVRYVDDYLDNQE
jgi:UDP-2-acetamido-3-amino-2,3-dideoxy-glucuronate N-acetyltransferase